MNLLGFLLISSLCVFGIGKTEIIKVSIYYEALCPDSINFIINQFYPGYVKFGDEYLNIDLVPFGFASANNSSGNWTFRCQHGPDECYSNKVQSCVIAANSPKINAKFVNCTMASNDPSDDRYLQECATDAGLSWDTIKDCIDSGLGDELLAKNGDITNNAQPPISYVPSIFFNDYFNHTLQDDGEHYFFNTICELLENSPDACNEKNEITVSLVD